ncbi:hypothetical protein [Stenotrophomonas sp. DR009]|uniref:hypothetical protein n=1 Tax=Stenotrophomonas sp. DR009 TaxID=3398461 RepID=UPI003BB21BB6
MAATADSRFAASARTFAILHAGPGAGTRVPNLHARIETLATAAGDLPVSVHDDRAGDAWVCSPRTTYSDYAAEEGARYLPSWAAPMSLRVIASLGRSLQWSGIDRAVSINNWLLSTNLYPSLALVDPAALLREAIARWPGHTLWFRSLNAHDNADWLAALQAAGGQRVTSRQVYLYDDFDALLRRHGNLKTDLALLRKTPLQHCRDQDVTEADYARIAEIYALLYICKHSRFNPVYDAQFLRLWHRAGLLTFEGFRTDDGRLACVVGLFRQGRTATAPIVGYDTAQPQKMALYRLATACAYRACLTNGWRLNFSAGAAGFKRLRGGVPAIEYSIVYARHLPTRTRMAVTALSTLTCRLGTPLLRRFRL